MRKTNSYAWELITGNDFESLKKEGLIDELAYRNYLIKYEYEALKVAFTTDDSVETLSNKYGLSDSAIRSILFRKRKIKKIYLPGK